MGRDGYRDAVRDGERQRQKGRQTADRQTDRQRRTDSRQKDRDRESGRHPPSDGQKDPCRLNPVKAKKNMQVTTKPGPFCFCASRFYLGLASLERFLISGRIVLGDMGLR